MTAPAPEVYSTIGIRPGMRVHNDSTGAPEHVVADRVWHHDGGIWDVTFRDCPEHVLCGARHRWVVTA
jgi:hypothetical protein